MRHAIDLGVNWIDTAVAYGLGAHSEEVVGRLLRQLPTADRPFLDIYLLDSSCFLVGPTSRFPWCWGAIVPKCSQVSGDVASSHAHRGRRTGALERAERFPCTDS
jgi:Aldo/keto reductase family